MYPIKHLVSAVCIGAALILAVWSHPAFAAKRVALVIGNSSYLNVPKLLYPAADADAIADMFLKAKFDSVELQVDANDLDFARALRKFADTASDADIAVVFFAGYGFEIGGTNYMIPIDAKLVDVRDAPDEAVSLDRMIDAVKAAKHLALVILDASRGDPSVGMRGHAESFSARQLVAPVTDGRNLLVAFAAKAGSTAEDGHGPHSPWTTALLDNLTAPGLDIRFAFGRMRDEVLKMTDNRQEPYVYGSLNGEMISLAPAPSQPAAPPPGDDATVKSDYELVKKLGSKKAWEIFLKEYPTGPYADLARAQLEQLNKLPPASQSPAQSPAHP
jgi:uncharacterized caspase-like protein